MRFHAKYVSVGESGGEYFAVSFDNEDPSNDDFDLSGDEDPYLIVQRQFEDDDGDACYIETHDQDTYSGHFRLRLISTPNYHVPVAWRRGRIQKSSRPASGMTIIGKSRQVRAVALRLSWLSRLPRLGWLRRR